MQNLFVCSFFDRAEWGFTSRMPENDSSIELRIHVGFSHILIIVDVHLYQKPLPISTNSFVSF
ncbi:unnamed protein product [Musa acuminata subsp. malaccensis]|uniref:(wild Malaysian banana) hypothetical protein n=1 Tax=Musa acuminata subsp. malaccensis TaxID=214687 RepID=A0A804JIB0_MUSAM|nr:unnamed protein product [Musa acuminata subsp. malaccensis]